MIKAKVTDIFSVKDETLEKYGKIEAIKQARNGTNSYLKNDEILISNEMAKYLQGANPLSRNFIEVVEVIPDEEKKEKKTTKKRVTNGTRKNSVKKD